MRLRKLFVTLGLLAAVGTQAGSHAPVPSSSRPAQNAPGSKPPANDAVLDAMTAEMERSKALLRMDRVPPPYYIEYRVTDQEEYMAEAALGALRSESRIRRRWLNVVVRIGDYQRDSSVGPATGVRDDMPLDDDSTAMRRQIWLATDGAYKVAAQAFAAKTAVQKQLTFDDTVDDFARAPVEQHADPPARLDVDAAHWRTVLERSSRLPPGYGDILTLATMARFMAVNRYFVNSEGTVARTAQARYLLLINGAQQAADGMLMVRSPAILVATAKELPSTERLADDARAVLDSLRSLSAAPAVDEEYHGPVLCLPDASNDIVAELVAKNVLGNRPPPGRPGRTTSAWANSLKSRVLPEFLTVVDDPTATVFGGQSLVGSYPVDDEGVRAAPVTVIENGRLISYLLGRTPIRNFPASNGHGRVDPMGAVSAAPSNLFLHSKSVLSRQELRKMMIERCRERDLRYGYLIETFGGITAPRMIHRVYVEDGRQELVRGAVLDQLDVRALRDEVIAVGDDLYVSNRPETLQTSVICPSILFGELTVKPSSQPRSKPPSYPPPALSGSEF